MIRRNVTILGATGSIGASTLDVLARHPDRFRVFALTAHSRADDLVALVRQHRPAFAVFTGTTDRVALTRAIDAAHPRTELLFDEAGLVAVASHADTDAVMAAIVGAAGLAPTLAAARAGKIVLLANKEALVMAGALFMQAVAAAGATLLPIDSEHNAIFQCLPPRMRPGSLEEVGVRRILLTGSGGPFRTRSIDTLARVTPDEACAHPTWSMGRKISVDSATMMNKALEIIEARWLFGASPERIEVVVHPQSVIHSMVEYADGSVLAQMGNPDMRTPIAHALAYPDRIGAGVTPLDLAAIGSLTFERPDRIRFPALRLAYEVLAAGGAAATVFNAANEIAVEAFLEGRLAFTGISEVIEHALTVVQPPTNAAESIEGVVAIDQAARREARRKLDKAS
jgi:1-deoxy-D-xylulose-5-phosphate reductoisomerase